MQEIIEMYSKGAITGEEACGKICMVVCSLATMPPELLAHLKKYLEKFPTADEDWQKIRTLYIGAFVDSQESWVKYREKDCADMRKGIEILRERL